MVHLYLVAAFYAEHGVDSTALTILLIVTHHATPNLCHVLEHVLGVLPANVNCRLPTSPVC